MENTIYQPTVRVAVLATLVFVAGFAATSLSAHAQQSAAQMQDMQAENTTTASTERPSLQERGMEARLQFTRSTPCTAYEVDWGDGETEQVAEQDGICTQVIDRVTLTHEYAEAGEYNVVWRVDDRRYTAQTVVPSEVTEFGLSEVASVSAEYIDPSPQVADEEYYIYTITLNNGETVALQVAAFTAREFRTQEFRDAGYTGDVDALLALASTDEMEDDTDATTTPTNNDQADIDSATQTTQAENERVAGLYRQMRERLTQLLDYIESWLAMQ